MGLMIHLTTYVVLTTIMYKYYIHYKIVCNDVDPPEIIENGVPIAQELPLTNPENIKQFADGIANSVATARKAPDGTISVFVLGWSKFDEPILIQRLHS